MSKKVDDYYNFPVCLLEGFLTDSETVLCDILYYVIYARSLTLEHSNVDNRFKYSADSLNVSLGGNIINKRKRGQEIYDSIPDKVPRTGIKSEMFWAFYKEDQSEFNKVCLLAFLGLKSIIGAKTYARSSQRLLLARMDGKDKSVDDYSELSIHIHKYATRRLIDKIILTLRLDYNLKYYSRYTHGFYVSFDLELEKLIEIAETKRISNQQKKLKEEEKELREKILKKLKG